MSDQPKRVYSRGPLVACAEQDAQAGIALGLHIEDAVRFHLPDRPAGFFRCAGCAALMETNYRLEEFAVACGELVKERLS